MGHNDLIWGTAWFIHREALEMFKYLISSMNGSYDSPCKRFTSASWVSIPPDSIANEKAEPMWFIAIHIPGASPKLPLASFFEHHRDRVPSKASSIGFGTQLAVGEAPFMRSAALHLSVIAS